MVLEKQLLYGASEDSGRTSKRSRGTRQVTSETTSNWIELARCVCNVCVVWPRSQFSDGVRGVYVATVVPTLPGCTSLSVSMTCYVGCSAAILEHKQSPRKLLQPRRGGTLRKLWTNTRRCCVGSGSLIVCVHNVIVWAGGALCVCVERSNSYMYRGVNRSVLFPHFLHALC